MKVYLFLTFVLFVNANFAFGQEASSAELKKTEMKKLDKMAGQWKGSGWIQQGPTKETFTGSENVQKKVDGLAVFVEGKFSNPAGKVIHETLAVLSYDDALKNYRFATYLANGITGVQDFKVVGDHYE